MKISELKNKFGMNLFSFIGWLIIFSFFILAILGEGIGFALVFFMIPIQILIILSLAIWVIEIIANHKVINKFILENKIYGIFWLIGMLFSILYTLFFISIFCFK